MIATHPIILFAAATLVNANKGFTLVGPKHYTPEVSLHDRIRTCNDNLSNRCRSIAEADIEAMARFIDILLEDGPTSIFHLIDHSPRLELYNKNWLPQSRKDLREQTSTKSLMMNLARARNLVNNAYNNQMFIKEQGWPSVQVPGQYQLKRTKIIEFLTSKPFERLKKQIFDFLGTLLVDISKLRPLKQKLCSNLGGLRRSSRDLRPVNYDYDASGDVELQRSKRHVDVTTKLTEGCIFSDSYSFRRKHCTQGALIDYGLADYLLSITTDFVSLLKKTC